MTINHGGYTFGGITTHGIPIAEPPELNDVVDQFMGIKGESEVTDMPHGRDVRIRADFMGFTYWSDLSAFFAGVEGKINVLSDQTLTVTLPWPGESSIQYPHCTFKRVEYHEEAFFDGSGVNGWIQKTTLVFRQLKISA